MNWLRSRAPRFALAAPLAMLTTACADAPVSPEAALLAKAQTSLSVTAASPAGATQESTLDVTITGSGFDRGSRAEWAIDGVVDPAKITTNSTRYVSSKELVANITVAADAPVDNYDVIVTTSTGKKGIGTELFTVQKRAASTAELSGTAVGSLGGSQGSVYGINTAGWIVGNSSDANGVRQAYVRASGATTLVQLPRPEGMSSGAAYGRAINDANVIVGTVADHPVLWRPNAAGSWDVELLPTLDGITRYSPRRINGAGRIAGFAFMPDGTQRPIVWETGGTAATVHQLPYPSDAAGATAHGMNESGVIVGWRRYTTADGTVKMRALVWTDPSSAPVQLPALASDPEQLAWSINDHGTIAGKSNSGDARATETLVLWQPSADGTYSEEPQAIATPASSSIYINNSGHVTFSSSDGHYLREPTGTLWKLAPLSGYTDSFSLAINSPAAGSVILIGGESMGESRGSSVTSSTTWSLP